MISHDDEIYLTGLRKNGLCHIQQNVMSDSDIEDDSRSSDFYDD